MPELKLAKLPDRTPVKISFKAGPELNQLLGEYAEFYRERYGQEEPVPELIPYILEAFLRGDAAFIKARREKLGGPAQPRSRAARARSGNGNAASPSH